MTNKERAVREAARAHFDAQERVQALRETPRPRDRDERRAVMEALAVAKAEELRCALQLMQAEQDFAQ